MSSIDSSPTITPAASTSQLRVPIKLIDRSGRARTDFSDVDKLAESIKRYGSIHPICVRPNKDGTYTLIAGERRLLAHLMAGFPDVPVTLRENIDDVTLKEMELEENLKRKDFHWTETTRLMSQLDKLKRQQHGSLKSGRYEEGKDGWTYEKTAELLGCSVATVSQDIKLAEDLEANPDIAKLVTHLPKDMARKKTNTLLEQKRLRQSLENKQIVITTDLLLGPCEQLVTKIPTESVHLVITDPPYADETQNAVGQRLSLQYAENTGNMGERDAMDKVYDILIPELYRVLVPGSHVYIFHAMSWYTYLHNKLSICGFIVDDVPLIWSKGRPTALPKDYHYMPAYEPITFAIKPPRGRPVLQPCPNVLDIPSLAPEKRVHPLQKPSELLSIFIKNSSNAGETILDPFAGSASVLMEARKLMRKAIGFEKDEGNYLRAQKYLQEEKENGQ